MLSMISISKYTAKTGSISTEVSYTSKRDSQPESVVLPGTREGSFLTKGRYKTYAGISGVYTSK